MIVKNLQYNKYWNTEILMFLGTPRFLRFFQDLFEKEKGKPSSVRDQKDINLYVFIYTNI